MPELKETLNFRFYDYYERNDVNIFYVEEQNPKNIALVFEIENKSGSKLVLDPYNQESQQTENENIEKIVSADNFHLELRFRPGVLSRESQVQIDLNDTSKEEWLMSRPVFHDNKEVSLYFLRNNSPLELAKEGKQRTTSLVLRGFGADSAHGSNITNVRIKYENFRLKQDSEEPEPISGEKVLQLTILSHRGLRKAPLEICFAKHKSILNDNKTSDEIELQISNISGEAIALSDKTEFTIEIDAEAEGRNEPWAVAKKDHAAEFEIAIKDREFKGSDDKSWKWYGEKDRNTNIEDPQLTLKNIYKQVLGTGEEDRSFASNDDLILVLSNVKSSLDSGRGQIRFFL